MTLQWLVVGIVVAACAVFSTWRLLSLRLRAALLTRAAAVLPSSLVTSRAFAHLQANVQAQMSGGCGACAAKEPPARVRR